MHVDLCNVRDLLALDREQDELKASARALADTLRDERRAHEQAVASVGAAEAALVDARERERQANRELETYTARQERTRKLLDTASLTDIDAAERQLSQIAEIIGRLETELLEAMDERESAERVLSSRGAEVTHAVARVEQARCAQREGRPAIEARYAHLRGERGGRVDVLRADQRGHYDGLRGKGLPVLVDIVDGVCEHCHVAPPPQMVLEVARERRVHTCRSCHCWFRDVVEPELPESGEE